LLFAARPCKKNHELSTLITPAMVAALFILPAVVAALLI